MYYTIAVRAHRVFTICIVPESIDECVYVPMINGSRRDNNTI